jgi:hypothetical protein
VVEKSAEEEAGLRSIDDQIREIGFKGLKSVPRESGEEDEEEDEPSVPPAQLADDLANGGEAAGSRTGGEAESLTPAMEEFSSAYQTVMRLLENGERISAMYRCARIQGEWDTDGARQLKGQFALCLCLNICFRSGHYGGTPVVRQGAFLRH